MKKFLATILLGLSVLSLYAQPASSQEPTQQQEDVQVIFMRNRIGIDYSIPDFSTKRINASIIGDHLAEMLALLQADYKENAYYRRLISILRDQQDFLKTPEIKKFTITEITKQGNVITVKTRYTLTKNPEGIKTIDIPFVFDKGVSDSFSVNSLFADLSRDVREED